MTGHESFDPIELARGRRDITAFAGDDVAPTSAAGAAIQVAFGHHDPPLIRESQMNTRAAPYAQVAHARPVIELGFATRATSRRSRWFGAPVS